MPSAYADLDAGDDIDLGGNVTVTPTAITNIESLDDSGRLPAFAYLYATADTGDLTVTGDILVTAYVEQTAASASYSGYASAYAYSGP